MSAVGALCCLHSTSGVALEVLPQPRARGKAFRTGFAPFFQFCKLSDLDLCPMHTAPVWLVPRVNPSVVDQVSLGSKGFSTLGAGEGSLSSVFAHVHYKYKQI